MVTNPCSFAFRASSEYAGSGQYLQTTCTATGAYDKELLPTPEPPPRASPIVEPGPIPIPAFPVPSELFRSGVHGSPISLTGVVSSGALASSTGRWHRESMKLVVGQSWRSKSDARQACELSSAGRQPAVVSSPAGFAGRRRFA